MQSYLYMIECQAERRTIMSVELLEEMGFGLTGLISVVENKFFVVTFPGHTTSAVHAYDGQMRHWQIFGIPSEGLAPIVNQLLESGYGSMTDLADVLISVEQPLS